MSKNGRRYKSASNHRIPNEGEQRVSFWTTENHACGLTIQVADVADVLICPADLTKAGNRVTLDEDEGAIENVQTGKRIRLEKQGKLYILWMWVPDSPAAVFPRPGGKP